MDKWIGRETKGQKKGTCTNLHKDEHTHTHTHTQKEIKNIFTERQMEKRRERQTDWLVEGWMDRETDKQKEWKIDRWSDERTDRQTDGQKGRKKDGLRVNKGNKTLTGCLFDWQTDGHTDKKERNTDR
jgi:hypothetical protein